MRSSALQKQKKEGWIREDVPWEDFHSDEGEFVPLHLKVDWWFKEINFETMSEASYASELETC